MDAGTSLLPMMPLPVQVEIELTGSCNARCTACPRQDMPMPGLMVDQTIARVIEIYRQPVAGLPRPEIIIAGGGEPLIHPRAVTLLKKLTDGGFEVSLTTNASRVSADMVHRLTGLPLAGIYVSFWGIERDEYQRAMSLDFDRNLPRVLALAQAARQARIPLWVKWLRVPELVSSDQVIEAFWRAHGVDVIRGYHDVWNRGGLIDDTSPDATKNPTHLPDPSRRIWCADLYFSDAISWRGDCILCCCNYFMREQICVGNVHENGREFFAAKKLEILEARPIPAICRVCRLPRDTRGSRLARAWLPSLSSAERRMLVEYP